MKQKILLLIFSLGLIAGANAQGTRIQLTQIATGAQGQIIMAGTDGNGQWVTPVFVSYGDTLTRIATKADIAAVFGAEIVSGTFNAGTLTLTRRNGTVLPGIGFGTYYIPETQKGAVNGVAPLGADGKVPTVYLPALAGRNTFVVASEAAMLATGAVKGDEAIRTDVNQSYVLQNDPASTLTNWVLRPNPGGYVKTVNGVAGENVTITTDNVSEGPTNKYFSNVLARAALSATGPLSYNNTTGAFGLQTSGITPGTYNNVTYDVYGRAIAGSNVAYLTGAALTNYYTKNELQTAGQSSVHWNNLLAVPANLGATWDKENFPAGSSSVLVLPFTPVSADGVIVFHNGVALEAQDYGISGNTITLGFTRNPAHKFWVVYPH